MRTDLTSGVLALLATALLATACDRPADPAAPAVSADLVTSSQISTTLSIPATIQMSNAMSSCDNSPGPVITMSGGLALGGLGNRLIFSNNEKDTHTYTASSQSDVTVIPAGDAVTIPKQPVDGGVGGNPFIWVQFTDDHDAPMSGEIFLGRCVQGMTQEADADLTLPVAAVATYSAADCSNSTGPTITLAGQLAVAPGIGARLIFRNNDNPVGGPHEFDDATVVRTSLLPPGQVIQFPKQPVLGGVGGNPWISFQWLDGTAAPIGDASLLGRCVQLSQTS